MGLGELHVHSSLDQPFDAEIDLIDIGDTPLSGINANLAPPAEYERTGLEYNIDLSILTFVVKKNHQGKPVVHISSAKNFSAPFVQLLIDLVWAKGQIYREYDILLDPPDYQLSVHPKYSQSFVKQPTQRSHRAEKTFINEGRAEGVTELIPGEQQQAQSQMQTMQVTYGPVQQGETIWQIAQRYKESGISIEQLILAIVGMNEQDFVDGNLNGLKVGVKLDIPTMQTAGRVPLADAKAEVAAHEKAWQTKRPIQHVLLPPYFKTLNNKESSLLESSLPSIKLTNQSPKYQAVNSYLFARQDSIPSITPKTTTPVDNVNSALKAQMDITTQAIESVRETNALLKEQLHSMEKQNQLLQAQIKSRDKELKSMHSQLELLMRRNGVAGQVIQSDEQQESNLWLWVLVIVGAGAAGVYVAWRKWGNREVLKSYFSSYFAGHVPNVIKDKEATQVAVAESEVKSESKPEPKSAAEPEVKSELTPEPRFEPQAEPTIAPVFEPSVSKRDAPDESPSQLSSTDVDKSKASKDMKQDIIVAPVEKKDSSVNTDLKVEKKTQVDIDKQLAKPSEEQTHNIKDAIAPQMNMESTIKTQSSLENAAGKDEAKTNTGIAFAEEPEEKLVLREADVDSDHLIEFQATPEPSKKTAKRTEKPVRSKPALDTLLNLAQTYIEMGDEVAARESLTEVIVHGSKKQQDAAKKLLSQLDKK